MSSSSGPASSSASAAAPAPGLGHAPRSNGKRSRTRRAGESAFGVLLLVRNVLFGLIALLLVVAGGWTSKDTVLPALSSDQRGTVQVTKCGETDCTGMFDPAAGDHGAAARQKVTIAQSVSGEAGERLMVAMRPGTKEAVRTGPAGVLYGAVPFGGSLVLAALLILLGMQWKRTALVTGLLGAAVMGGAWAGLSF